MAWRLRNKKDSRQHPYTTVESVYRKSQSSYSGAGGFLVEDDEEDGGGGSGAGGGRRGRVEEVEEEGLARPIGVDDDQQLKLSEQGFPICVSCEKEFPFSFLYDSFTHPVCDSCRDENREAYKLITRTEAKDKYVLKDSDLDSKEPKLRFISKKNPHNPQWGDMKLYLKTQVERRGVELWGGSEGVEEEKERRVAEREKRREKHFEKKLKDLRREVRGEGKLKSRPAPHEHTLGTDETYDPATDTYSKQCTSCNYKQSYEKL